MCGIHALISTAPFPPSPSDAIPHCSDIIRRRLRARGPDHWGQIRLSLPIGRERPRSPACLPLRTPPDGQLGKALPSVHVCLTSTVLAMRGGDGKVTAQPFASLSEGEHDEAASAVPRYALCWNGEAWSIDGFDSHGGGDNGRHGSLGERENDGAVVFRLLCRAAAGDRAAPSLAAVHDRASDNRGREDDGHGDDAVSGVLRRIRGPFAFVFLDTVRLRLYYGRDRLGRRSLVTNIQRQEDGAGLDIRLSSVAENANAGWKEVPARGVHTLHLDRLSADGEPVVETLPWVEGEDRNMVASIARFNRTLPPNSAGLEAGSPAVQRLRALLTDSLRTRVLNVPDPPGITGPADARVAILFSGGLDCTVLARLSHELVAEGQSIDLVNVAFENPRVAAQLSTGAAASLHDIYESCPDRITGRRSFQQLLTTCPGRIWRFIAANVPYAETIGRKDEVVSLMYPHRTEMDLSISYALYFAARGRGVATTPEDPESREYQTTARVLLSGLGADELFGGYVRHATAFARRGYEGLIDELQLDVGRICDRNLGRDDRIMAQWGREVRFPYLDEALIGWAAEAPVWQKCDFHSPGHDASGIEPGKRVLRLLAEDLGMHGVAREKKRAIQFGSRTAKMESGKTKGTSLIS